MTSRLFLNWSEPLLLATKSSCLPLPANRKHLVQNLGFLMTDYYPMIARCVADLEDSVTARHEFYWLARAELAVQLCGLDPPIAQSKMIRERLALDEAIRKVEAERVSSVDTQRQDPVLPQNPILMPSCGSTVERTDIRLCLDMGPGTQGRRQQPSDAIAHGSTNASN